MATIKKVNVKKAYETRLAALNAATENIENIFDVFISTNNSKLGLIPSFSVLPILTCTNCGSCSGYCYSAKNAFNFPDNIKRLASNTALVKEKPQAVIDGINAFLNNQTIIYKYFRFNVAGDVFSVEYLNIICTVAKANPVTRFLVFTKNYELFNEYADMIPENVNVVFSIWDNTEIENPHGFPVAIVKVDDNTNIPAAAFHCSGDCSNCLKCWHVEAGHAVYFDLH